MCDDSRVLDVGCGTGSLAQVLADMTRRTVVVGIDPAQAFIEYSRSRFSDTRFSFDVGNAMDLPYPSGSFDQSLLLPERAALRGVTGDFCTGFSTFPGLVFLETLI